MNLKQFFKRVGNTLKNTWEHGKIQRTSRITYDVIWNIILFFVIVGTIVFVFAGGVGAGYFASLVKDEPIREYEDMKKDIYNYEETSKLYFADNKYIGDIRADLHREEIKLEDVSDLLIKAVIATEDQLFYEHNGIVPKAIVRALYQEISNADTKTGGSTLTQQLIKNQILTNEVSFERKAKEILLAMRLEHFFEKDEILEAYLNIIPYGREASGRNVAGIQTAARGVFGVDAQDLTLPQAAFLAGVPQNPFAYTPFTNTGEVKDEEGLARGLKRMETVLQRMYQAEFITEAEYEEAIHYDITADFTEQSASPIDKYPAIVFELEKRAKAIITEQLAKADGLTIEEVNSDEELMGHYSTLADRALRMDGYHIHSTINKKMFDAMKKVGKEYKHYGPDNTFRQDGEDVTEIVEAGAVLIENSTGKILSFFPGREYSVGHEYNFATQARRQPGSTIKPLAVYAPAFDMGALQPGSVIADVPTPSGKPGNYGGAYYGLVSVREALTYSYNVTAHYAYMGILGQNPGKNYLMKMGIPLTAGEQEYPSIALGGMDHGMTVEQNTNAFATFSNQGNYIPSYMIEKITDSDGNIIYEHQSEPVEVFSPQSSYLTIDIMRDVIRRGTAASLPSRLKYGGVDWAGKTGTTDKYKDAWFVGTNPNVTLGTWIGYETPSSIYCRGCSLSYSQRNQFLWANFINALTEIDPELMAPQGGHKRPEGIVSRSYCAASGMAPSDICSQAGLVRADIYDARYVPNKKDDSLIGGDMPLVVVDGEQIIAHENTPSEFTTENKGGFAFNPEFIKRKGYDRLGNLSLLIPRKNPEAWQKIGIEGVAVTDVGGTAIEEGSGKKPPAPGSLKANKTKVTWSGAKGHLIVGYRIYYAKEKGQATKLIGHTTDLSYTIPDTAGVYYIKAVNYFGQESELSKAITVDVKEKEKEKDQPEKKPENDDGKIEEPDQTEDPNNEEDKENSDSEDSLT